MELKVVTHVSILLRSPLGAYAVVVSAEYIAALALSMSDRKIDMAPVAIACRHCLLSIAILVT